MPRMLVTGANRGLGLEFVKQYAADGWTVDACCRSPEKATALHEMQEAAPDTLKIHRLDVGDFDAVDRLSKELNGCPIELLINNAGIYRGARVSPADLDYEEWLDSFRVNTIAPIKMAEAFLPQLEAGAEHCVVNISSKMGSIADNTSGSSYPYRSSKAALNASVKSMSIDLKDKGVIVAMHPGWVATDMGGANAPLSIPQSVASMRKVIGGLKIEDSGRFLAFDGEELPW